MLLPLHRTFVLTGITFALSAVYSLSYARDEFNLRILELDSPLENTQVLEDFVNNNNLTPGVYLTSVMWVQEYLDKRNITFILSSDKKGSSLVLQRRISVSSVLKLTTFPRYK